MEKKENGRVMNASPPTKVVQSGKVYRQKFDAEVQLVRALTENELKRRNRDTTGTFRASKEASALGTGIPIVKDSGNPQNRPGMLTERQRTWLEGFPNEYEEENPVMIKYYSEESDIKVAQANQSLQSSEVQGLPDVVSPVKKGSDIIERIAESRKKRHVAALEDMHQELGVLNSRLEPTIVEIGEVLIAKLSENDEFLEELSSAFSEDSQLAAFSKQELDDIWRAMAKQSQIRRTWIEELDGKLLDIERNRMQEIRAIFCTYSEQLEKISHMMAPQLQRLLDHESQIINQTVLSNKRAYTDLNARLMLSDIEREKKLHSQWRRRVEDWKKLHTEKAVQQFVHYMSDDQVMSPPSAALIVEEMKQQQRVLNSQREGLLDTLLTFKPPSSTKAAVYKWNQELTTLSKQIDKLNQEYFTALCKEYEKVCQDCLQKAQEVKLELISRGVCSERRAQIVITERCLPLVGERQTTFEKELEQMDKTLESHNGEVLQMLHTLFRFCQGAAHVWDNHELGLAKAERALQEKLDECRRKHDHENQDKEANLDIVMDRMRQDATEISLQESLKKALDMLNNIKQGYSDFHSTQCELVQTYPQMVEEELLKYDTTLCKFFSISRSHPEDETLEPPSARDPTPPPKVKVSARPKGKRRGLQQEVMQLDKREAYVPMVVNEILNTAKGTTFYVLTVAPDHDVNGTEPQASTAREGEPKDGVTSSVFPTELPVDPITSDATESKPELPHYVKNVHISNEKVNEVKKRIRMNLLDHLEEWYDTAMDRANIVVSAKTEELNSELDLRLHLHEPRSRRTELDVHNVRAAELVIHNERVTRHCKGINQALADLKQRFTEITLEHNKLSQKFRKDIESLESVFINATKSSNIVALSNQLQVEQEKFMDRIRASLRQFRTRLDDTLQSLRQSNASFIKSFRIFSDGGNFCPEEIEEFRKKLEKMSQKIDSAEGFIMADLEGMESKRLEHATRVSTEFSDRFKNHMVDLIFMEKIARWLTNTQVKIKAEVADSNSQAARLSQHLKDLDRRIDACERPNLDKEQITPTELNNTLPGIFADFYTRSIYLNCMKAPVKDSMGFATLVRAKVGFTQEILGTQRGSKQIAEDPSIHIIRNILKTQKSRLGLDTEADEQKDAQPRRGKGGGASVPVTALQVSAGSEEALGAADSQREKSKSRQSHRSDGQSVHSKKSGKSAQTGAATSQGAETAGVNKRIQSGITLAKLKRKYGPGGMYNSNPKSTRMMFSKSKGIDKKYFVFGEYGDESEAGHLLGRVKVILRESLEGLLASSEVYYRQKGGRAVTRPQALQETFEQCSDVLVQKLQSYNKQCDTYHNDCLQEFRRQLDQLEDLVFRIPKLVIEERLKNAIEDSRNQQEELDAKFRTSLNDWNQQKTTHQADLRPPMGHPNERAQLQELCDKEEARRQAYLQGVETHTTKLQELTGTLGSAFVESSWQMADKMLRQFDAMLTIDDVEKGRVPVIKHDVAELQRRKNAGKPLEDEEVKEKMARGKNNWPGIPTNEVVNPHLVVTREQMIKEKASRRTKDGKKKEAPTNRTPAVTTQKTTLGHKATHEAVNDAYQSYKRWYESSFARIAEQKQEMLIAEERWTKSWTTAIDKVKELY